MICPICEAEVSQNETVCRSCGASITPENASNKSGALPVGSKLLEGQYTIGRVLGRGSFGVTYLGSDIELRRSVGIKELFPSGCARNGESVEPGGNWSAKKLEFTREKFLNEARVLAQFQHPNIVHVYRSFEQNNTAYMVMEYLKGRTLQQLIREFTVIPEPEAVDYVVQLSDALRHIHGANYLHRDIKPGNILVADDGRITLIDFGTARQFALDSDVNMTTMLTPGYAPLEQYTRSGKMGPFSDVYSVAATLYHMLTGQQPIAATDQANGAILVAPRQMNESVSEKISNAIMWSMQMEASQRPQTVEEFLGALEGQVTGPTSRRRATQSLSSDGDDGNPYKERIERIVDELSAGVPPAPRGDFDDQIDEISKTLSAITSVALPVFPTCPACFAQTVKELKGDTATKTCPICRKVELSIQDLDLKPCPICRDGVMRERRLAEDEVFCPVCRKQPLQVEHRKRFGFAVSENWVCSNCRADLRIVLGGRAKLDNVGRDPYGIAGRHRDDALTLDEWQEISTRLKAYLECSLCHAQLDLVDGQRSLRLGWYDNDPFGVGQKAAKQPLGRFAWANIAHGQPAHTPNATCSGCNSKFEIDDATQEIKATTVNAQAYPWSQRLLNKPIPFRSWRLAIAGKRSPNPGCLCQNCRTEFDYAEKLLKLVWTTPGRLSGREGQTHSREGWQRIGAGMPTKAEEAAMRDDLTKLYIKKQEQQENFFAEEAKFQEELKKELDGLIHSAFVEGYVPILLKDTSIFLLEGETLFWESPVKRNQRTSVSGAREWTFEIAGVLLLTNQRLIFASKLETWQHSLDEIEKIEVDDEYKGRMVAVYLNRRAVPVGFDVGPSEFTVTTEFSNHTIRANARDFVMVAKAVRAHEVSE